MTGIKDPTEPPKTVENQVPHNGGETYMQRFLDLPPFTSVSSIFCDAYKTVRGSHESVTSILTTVENHVNEGIELIVPLTGKISAALETPLKGVNNAISGSLDIFKDNESFLENIKDSFRSMIEKISYMHTDIMKWVDQLIGQGKLESSKLQITSKSPSDTSANDKS